MVTCPNCGGELTYIPQYDRYYCYICRKYPPKDRVSKGTGVVFRPATVGKNQCPTCGKELSYIPKYDRWYCYECLKYAPKNFLKHQFER